MKTKILITGASGKIGLPLTEQLADMRVPFRALVHSPLKEPLLSRWTTDIVAGDYGDTTAMEKAFDGIDRVYLVSPSSPDQFRVQAALVDTARRKGVKHIVKLSALGTSPYSPVGILRSHAAIEEYIRTSGVAYTFLHPHFFMENLLANAHGIRKDGAIYSPLGDAAISVISVHDIAAVAAAVLTGEGHAGRTYQLTGPKAVTYDEIATTIGAVIGGRVVSVPITFEAARQNMIRAGMPEWFAEDIIRMMKTWAEGKGSKVTHDVELVLERQPISLREFLECHKAVLTGKLGEAA